MKNIKGDGPDFSGPIPQRKRSFLDKVILGVVVVIAAVVIGLSFQNTAKLAHELNLNPYLTAGLVELLFASLLFIRGRQRALQRNVPFFLSVGYFASLGFVTGINMWGLAIENPTIGPIVGVAISLAMWLMESTLVWLWTASHQPHKVRAKELERKAKREIEEIKIRQKIDWMRWEAQLPDMDLIKQARKEEEKRKAIVAEGMPTYFAQSETILAERAPVEDDREVEPATSEDITTTKTATTGHQDEKNRPGEPVEISKSPNEAESKNLGTDKHIETSKNPVVDKKKAAISKSPNLQKSEPKLRDTEAVFSYAMETYQKTGKNPTRRQLIENLNTTEHFAKQALARLKEAQESEAAATTTEPQQTQLKLIETA